MTNDRPVHWNSPDGTAHEVLPSLQKGCLRSVSSLDPIQSKDGDFWRRKSTERSMCILSQFVHSIIHLFVFQIFSKHVFYPICSAQDERKCVYMTWSPVLRKFSLGREASKQRSTFYRKDAIIYIWLGCPRELGGEMNSTWRWWGKISQRWTNTLGAKDEKKSWAECVWGGSWLCSLGVAGDKFWGAGSEWLSRVGIKSLRAS